MRNDKLLNYFIPLLIFPLLSWSMRASAHGVQIQYRQVQAIEIKAAYDDGKPMANAQVVIYAPDDPATPWIKGTTDQEGRFTFVPDPSVSGNWDVKVRQSGHGNLIAIPLGKNATVTQVGSSSSFSAGYTRLQKAVMAAAGVWGFVGTALFFSQRKVEQ